jgi:hypothetical protein
MSHSQGDTARQQVRDALRTAKVARSVRAAHQAARDPLAPPAGDPGPRQPGPVCATCGTELDPDGSCFMCRAKPPAAPIPEPKSDVEESS